MGDIFGKRNRLKGKNKIKHVHMSTVSAEKYPMFVTSVAEFLELEKLLPHQEMLRAGKLERVTPMHAGKILFISHEWTAFDHPDPFGVQLKCLQTLIQRLSEGGDDEAGHQREGGKHTTQGWSALGRRVRGSFDAPLPDVEHPGETKRDRQPH